MGFFGIGAMEAFVILVVALLIFGPGRLPEIMGDAGRMVRDFRRATQELTGDFQESIHEVRSTAEELQTEMIQTRDELEEDMRRTAQEFESSTEEIAETVTDAVPTPRGQQRPAGKAGAVAQASAPPSLESEAQQAEAKGKAAQHVDQPSEQATTGSTSSDSEPETVESPPPATKKRSPANSTPSKADPLADLVGFDDDFLSSNGSSDTASSGSPNGKRQSEH